jgi:ATP-binding cassette, subfamily B, bacterial PglK
MRIPAIARIWTLLIPAERRAAGLLLGLMVAAMLLEMLGVGLLLPAIALLAGGELTGYPSAAPILSALGNPGPSTLLAGGVLALLAVFSLKALLLAALAWRQNRFVFGLQARLSYGLLVRYMQQPHTVHLQRNSSQLLRDAINGVDVFTVEGLTSAMLLVSEGLVLIGIGVILLVVEPVGAAVGVAVVATAGWGFHQLTHGRIMRWGDSRQKHEGLRIQHLQQTLSALKEIRLLGRTGEFAARFQVHNIQTARTGNLHRTMIQMPRIALEVVAVATLAAIVLTLLAIGRPPTGVLAAVAFFGFAAFRLIPSVNRTLIAIQGIRFSTPVIETLYAQLIEVEQPPPVRTRGSRVRLENAVLVDGVSYTYPGASKPALRKVSLSIPSRETVGLIGTSGAGKSTLTDIILGLLQPDEGRVLVDGDTIGRDLRGWQDQLGYVPQAVYLTDDTIARNVAFGVPEERISESAVWASLEAARLADFVRSLPHGLDTMVGEHGVRLSGGQRQRVGIARALYHDPAVLVLDEPTSALDTRTEADVLEAIGSLAGSRTILIVSHRASALAHCTRLYRLAEGRIVEATTPDDMLVG